jgi:hypothetical protein
MDTFADIRDIWKTANVSTLPNADEMVRITNRYRLKHAFTHMSLSLLSLLMAATMIWVVFIYESHMLETRIGEACFLAAIFMLLTANATSLNRIAGQDNNSNSDFIAFLKQEQRHQIHFYKRTQGIGFTLSAVGLSLYIFEPVHNDTTTMVVAYSLLAIFLLASWFMLRPIAMKNKTKRLHEMIDKLEELSTQLQTTRINS